MKVVFMGTPEFAVPVLDALRRSSHEVVAVIAQPDREKDKKGNILRTPVHAYCDEHGLRYFAFDRISDHVSELIEFGADVFVTAAFGQLLSRAVLEVPSRGVLNVHASVLPAYRGSSPIQSAILAGDKESGVTIMQTDIGMDTGDILSVKKLEISNKDTYGSLSDKLSVLGADLLIETLSALENGNIKKIKQDESLANHCKKISKADGVIDWSRPASEISCKIRAYNPWPIAYTFLDGTPFKIYEAEVSDYSGLSAGEICIRGGDMTVGCGEGSLRLITVQLPGKKAMPVAEFLRGHKTKSGCVLG